MIDELDALGKQRDDAWQIPRVEGELLHHIALSAGARTVVEIGTSYGFSGLFWVAALRKTGGRLHTIEGNTGQMGFQNNGGGVFEHTDRTASVVLAVARPDYS